MKTALITLLTLMTSVSAYANRPNSTGHDLVCLGFASLSTPFYTCQTDYGSSDHCSDQNVNIDFSLNRIRGDLSQGVSGEIAMTEITFVNSVGNNPQLEQKLKNMINNTTGVVAYANKQISLKVTTDLGTNVVTQSVDFSKGVRSSSAWITLKNADQFGEVFIPELGLSADIMISCSPGT